MMDFKDKEESEIARELALYLREKVMAYWHDTSVDSGNGGICCRILPVGQTE